MGDGGGSGGPGARAAGTWGAGSASLVLPTQVLLERELEQLSEELDKDMRAMETRRHPCQVPQPLPTRASLALACCPSSLPGLGGPEERCRADGAHIQLCAHPAACASSCVHSPRASLERARGGMRARLDVGTAE